MKEEGKPTTLSTLLNYGNSIEPTRAYKLDWDKVQSVEHIKLLLQIHWGIINKPDKVYLHLTARQHSLFRDILKDEGSL